jgi:hypothetical protein
VANIGMIGPLDEGSVQALGMGAVIGPDRDRAESSIHKHQISNKDQIRNSNDPNRVGCPAAFGSLNFRSLEFVWVLGFEPWCFRAPRLGDQKLNTSSGFFFLTGVKKSGMR